VLQKQITNTKNLHLAIGDLRALKKKLPDLKQKLFRNYPEK
jgi:hypothetical protein